MTLYHGSNIIVEKPVILPQNRFLDFGQGFYTTSDKDQALHYSKIVASRKGGFPIVTYYNYDNISAESALNILRFVSADIKWLEFVAQNRNGTYRGDKYDIVIGPVADDGVYEVVNFYRGKVYTAEDAIKRLMAWHLHDQITFTSERSLQFLAFSGSILGE